MPSQQLKSFAKKILKMYDKWIVKHHVPPKPKIRLLCLPFGGSGSSFYLSWVRDLEPDVEVVPIQLPGRENRLDEPPFAEINQLTAEIIPAIQHYSDKPYAIFGHSMGAFLAFELAREMRRKNLSAPKLLLVSAMRAAHLKDIRPPIACLPDGPLMEALRERYALEVSEESMELLQLMLPTIRADILCIENYTYKSEPPFDFPIIVFGGELDHAVTPSEIEAWSRHTTVRFKHYQIAGGHFFVNSERDQLVKLIRNELTDLF